MVLQSKESTLTKSELTGYSGLTSVPTYPPKTKPPRSYSQPVSVPLKLKTSPSDKLRPEAYSFYSSQQQPTYTPKTKPPRSYSQPVSFPLKLKLKTGPSDKLRPEAYSFHSFQQQPTYTPKTKPPRSYSQPVSFPLKLKLKTSQSDKLRPEAYSFYSFQQQLPSKQGPKQLGEERDEYHMKEEVVDDIKREGTDEQTSNETEMIKLSAGALTMTQELLSYNKDMTPEAKQGLKPLRREKDEYETKRRKVVDDIKPEGTEAHISNEVKVIMSSAKSASMTPKWLPKIHDVMHEDIQTLLDKLFVASETRIESNDATNCHTTRGEAFSCFPSLKDFRLDVKMKMEPVKKHVRDSLINAIDDIKAKVERFFGLGEHESLMFPIVIDDAKLSLEETDSSNSPYFDDTTQTRTKEENVHQAQTRTKEENVHQAQTRTKEENVHQAQTRTKEENVHQAQTRTKEENVHQAEKEAAAPLRMKKLKQAKHDAKHKKTEKASARARPSRDKLFHRLYQV